MRWILVVCAFAIVFGIAATMTVPAQTITPDQATLKLFPPETTGLAFIDAGGLRSAQLVQELRPGTKYPAGLQEFIAATGFDPQRDLDQVTVAKIGKREFVAVVRARFDRFKVEQLLRDRGLETDSYLGRVLYMPARKQGPGAPMIVSFIDDLIVAGNTAAVKQVIDRLAAPAQSVLDNPNLMAAVRGIEVGNQVWAVGQFDLDAIPESARIPAPALEFVRNFTSGSYQMRVDTDVHVKAVGVFTSDAAARQTAEVLRGLLAVGKLQTSRQQDMLHLLDGVQIDYSGSSLTVRFEGDGELLKRLQTQRAR